jgi:hypothetical protein
MKKIFFCSFFYFFCCVCFAQNNNPQPPFSNLYRRPSVHPYTFISPDNNAMDYQQMFYLQNKSENILNQNFINNKQNYQNHYQNYNIITYGITTYGIRPTGHKTYFMNLP